MNFSPDLRVIVCAGSHGCRTVSIRSSRGALGRLRSSAAGCKSRSHGFTEHLPITNLVVNLTEEELRALFNVLWAFERINGLFVSLQRSWFSSRLSKAQKLLLDVSAGAITTWSSYLQFDVRGPSGKQLDLVPSKNGLVNLAEKLQVHQSR